MDTKLIASVVNEPNKGSTVNTGSQYNPEKRKYSRRRNSLGLDSQLKGLVTDDQF